MVRLEIIVRSTHVSYDDPGHNAIYLVKTGFLRILRLLDDGREVTVELIGPGSLFGYTRGGSTPLSSSKEIAEAIGEATVCVFGRESFERTMRTWPNLYQQVADHDLRRLELMRERLIDLAFKSVPSRIASFLLRHASDYGKQSGDALKIEGKLTQKDVADLIGASRQTVATELNRFRELGLIDFDRNSYVISNANALQEIVSAG